MIAQLHLLYDTNKYKELLADYPSMRPALPAALQPEAMLMAANSDRQLGHHQEARAVYDELITQFANTPQAPEARYQRIISLYAADDPNFPKEADDFLLASTDPTKSDEVRLMKADTLFKRRDYQGAALAYSTLDSSYNLPPKYKAEALYRPPVTARRRRGSPRRRCRHSRSSCASSRIIRLSPRRSCSAGRLTSS